MLAPSHLKCCTALRHASLITLGTQLSTASPHACVQVQHVPSGKELTLRCPDGWVKRGADFRMWRRGVQPTETSQALVAVASDASPFKYEFKFVTGRSAGAGTDSPVVVSVWGEDAGGVKRVWDPVPLEVTKGHFESAQTDSFVVGREDDIGELKGLTVRARSFWDRLTKP